MKDVEQSQLFTLDMDVVRIITKHLSKALKATLFGIDIIKETSSGDYYVIDINVFSRYKGVENFSKHLYEHIQKVYNESIRN